MSAGGFGGGMIRFSCRRPRLIAWVMALSTFVLIVLAALPAVWPRAAEVLNSVTVDTDPENMLPTDAPVRVFHNARKKEFSLYDIVVVGVVNEIDPDGVFNPDTLARIFDLSEFVLMLQWPDPDDPERRIGVVEADMLSPSTVDNIEQAGPGAVSFSWLRFACTCCQPPIECPQCSIAPSDCHDCQSQQSSGPAGRSSGSG